jgi:hypothetical protein
VVRPRKKNTQVRKYWRDQKKHQKSKRELLEDFLGNFEKNMLGDLPRSFPRKQILNINTSQQHSRKGMDEFVRKTKTR